MRHRLINWLRNIFFWRVPLCAWFFLLAIGPALMNSKVNGLLYVPWKPEIWAFLRFVCLSASIFLAAAACLVNFHLIAWCANARFRTGDIRTRRPGLLFAVAHVAPIVLLATILWTSDRAFGSLPALLLGYLAATAVVVASEFARAAFTSPNPNRCEPSAPVSLIWPAINGGHTWVSRHLRRYREQEVPSLLALLKRPILAAWTWPRRLLEPFIAEGYHEPQIAPAHAYAACVAALSFAVYLTLALLHQRALFGEVWSLRTPTFTWIALLLGLLTFVLSAFTFFFDRFRFPLLLGCLLLMTLTSTVPESDHFYRLAKAREWNPPTAAEVLRLRDSHPIILISAPGGGIQSAAWTTYALSELDVRYRRATNRPLMADVTAISAVSGGAVGVFHLAAAGFDPHRAYDNSIKSSIDDVVWGFLVPDLGRAVFPWGRNPELDRGFALEQSLEQNACVKDLFLDDPRLAPNAQRPALLINSTLLETGEPIVFGTTSFRTPPPASPNAPACGPQLAKPPHDGPPLEHWNLYRRPIRLATAARLSSTFPYVSPSARSSAEAPACPDFHLLDGGYYDNYGILSLAHWLLSGELSGAPKRKVILLNLRPFPPEDSRPSVAGWGQQATAPIDGVLNARESSQKRIADLVLDLSRRTQLNIRPPIEIRYQPAPGAHCAVAPLNWVLTKHQIACLKKSLRDEEIDVAAHRLLEESK